MVEIRQTATFAAWMANLRDIEARAVVARRIQRMAAGNFGDRKVIGGGVSELRIDFGPGYRVDYTQRGRSIILLLCGGDKATQSRDITKAKLLSKEVE